MIRVTVFNREKPTVIKAEGTIQDFVDWMSEGEIIGIQEYGTDNYFFVPSTKYVIEVQEIDE